MVEDVGCVVVVEQVVAADPESPVSFGLGLCAETCQTWQVEYPGHATRFFVRGEVSQQERSVLSPVSGHMAQQFKAIFRLTHQSAHAQRASPLLHNASGLQVTLPPQSL